MKKTWMIVVMVLCFSVLSGCGSYNAESDMETTQPVTILNESDWQVAENVTTHSETAAETELDVNAWGVKYQCSVSDNEGNFMWYYINFPVSNGKDRAAGRIGYQDGDVLAIVSQRYSSYDGELPDNIEDIFPTFFPQVIDIQEANQTSTAYDYAFDITSQELVEINGYQMCRYEGNHTYEFNHENYSHRYVAYATEVADGAYVFWMLIDKSEDNSSFDLASEYALKMAYTLRTEE